MALTVFLFKIGNLNLGKDRADPTLPTQVINEENLLLCCAKVSFRGTFLILINSLLVEFLSEIHLWSNNVPIQNNSASFIARGNKAKKFQFNLGSELTPNEKLHIEFYTVPMKKNRKKLFAVFELLLESLIETKFIDLAEENLSDSNNYLIESTIQMKLYYTPPNTERKRAIAGGNDEEEEESSTINWQARFDDEGRHGGHRYRHIRSKNDTRMSVSILSSILISHSFQEENSSSIDGSKRRC